MPRLTVVESLDDALDRVETLLEAVSRHDDHPPLADAKLVEVHGHAPASGFALVAEDGGSVVGVALAVRPGGSTARVWSVQQAVHPDARVSGLPEELAGRAVEEAWARGASRVQWWAAQAGGDDDALAAGLGLAPWRDLVQMRRPLPTGDRPALPPGTTLRAFEPGEDDTAWLEVNRRAFAEHPEQRTITRTDLSARMAESWFRADDFILAEDGKGLAGFCWVKIPSPAHGEVYVIGVDPRCQGSGLGRALVLAGLARMAERAAPEARLYTDGDNAAALALYESLGFTRHHVDRAYAAER